MKKLAILLVCFLFALNLGAQNKTVTTDLVWTVWGAASDTVKSNITKTYTVYISPYAKYVKLALASTNVSGTSNVVIRPYQSMDYVNWTALDSASTSGSAETITAVYTVNAPYFKWIVTGWPGVTGTTKVKVTALIERPH